MADKKWTERELWKHIKLNVEDYGAAIVVAALYKRLYGSFPKIGLSGAQAECADSIIAQLPIPNPNASPMSGIKGG